MPGACAACACGGVPGLPQAIRKEWLEALTAKTKLSDSEVKALYARFRRLAPSGYMLPEEFLQTMGVLGLSEDRFFPERMFHVFNSSGDGKLSFEEFATALAVMLRGTEDEKLKLSFEMAAGHREASELSLEDFQRLIHACNGMMSSLVAPTSSLTSDEDAARLFHDITSHGDKNVITFEAYKAAAQGSDEFLHALGISPGLPRLRGGSKDWRNRGFQRAGSPVDRGNDGPRQSAGATFSPHRPPEPVTPSSPAASSAVDHVGTHQEDSVSISAQEWKEFQAHLARIEALVKKQGGLRSQSSFRVDESDTQVLTSDDLPVLRAESVPSLALPCVRVEDAWQDLCKVAEGLGIHNNLSGGWPQAQGISSGLMDLSPCSASTTGPFAPTHRAGTRDLDLMGAPATSRAYSRDSSAEGDVACERRPPRRMDTMQAKHRSNSRRRRRHRLHGASKGLSVHFGHESWNTVLSMMIGIRMSVARSKHETHRELQPVDFVMQEKFTITPRLASGPDSDGKQWMTRFVDYAPLVFQKIRASFGINEDEYLRSSGPEQLLGNMVLGNLSSLSELSSEGKSGAFFYYTADGNYMMKTVTPKEFEVLRQMLKQYYDHIAQNPSTLVVRFLGLHCLRVQAQRSYRLFPQEKKELFFVVMANMFNTPCEINRRYDLKGSWVGRVTPPEKKERSVALKDVDFQQAGEQIRVGEERREKLLAQIKRDSEFLASNNIIDYSLLLGIHEREDGAPTESANSQMTSYQARSHDASEAAAQQRRTRQGEWSSDDRTVYFMGIIDILTPYDGLKKIEHTVKAVRYDSKGVSCCPPVQYAARFNRFMENAFA
eukprot:TRINITY_DN96_c0_g1_i1.p1 TRINITY_DN96_c0_g1~~TRINITY_DN96_c0_g1_i1.p1  ORF type:complete len:831 (+),score=148.52 TRINITY_DN96_c0_g1_i1:79-2571(+)